MTIEYRRHFDNIVQYDVKHGDRKKVINCFRQVDRGFYPTNVEELVGKLKECVRYFHRNVPVYVVDELVEPEPEPEPQQETIRYTRGMIEWLAGTRNYDNITRNRR